MSLRQAAANMIKRRFRLASQTFSSTCGGAATVIPLASKQIFHLVTLIAMEMDSFVIKESEFLLLLFLQGVPDLITVLRIVVGG